MAYMKKIAFRTAFEGMHNITADVQQIVAESGIREGMCYIHCIHTTASLLITSFHDPRGHLDFMKEIDKIVPTRNDFLHTADTPTDASGHVKSAMVGTALTLFVTGGKALLGSSQGVFFAEFDGPRDRQVFVKVVSD